MYCFRRESIVLSDKINHYFSAIYKKLRCEGTLFSTEPSARSPPYYQILQVGIGMRRKLRSTFFLSEGSKAYAERAGKGNWVGDWTKVRCARQSARRSRIEGWKSIHTSGCKHLSRITFLHPGVITTLVWNQEKMTGQRGKLRPLAGISHVYESYFQPSGSLFSETSACSLTSLSGF